MTTHSPSLNMITHSPSLNMITHSPSLNMITHSPSLNMVTHSPSPNTSHSRRGHSTSSTRRDAASKQASRRRKLVVAVFARSAVPVFARSAVPWPADMVAKSTPASNQHHSPAIYLPSRYLTTFYLAFYRRLCLLPQKRKKEALGHARPSRCCSATRRPSCPIVTAPLIWGGPRSLSLPHPRFLHSPFSTRHAHSRITLTQSAARCRPCRCKLLPAQAQAFWHIRPPSRVRCPELIRPRAQYLGR
ncbi:hypothetical protein PMIN03_009369 [Paraphaeosphaeria minitans]